ncbi:MAG: hypothetical protein KatS3mg081_0839 [Gemmatimonadales bacterium]|nr:MAG: hypothetical protein KatS3mg081_0839 [Gemmatimonadales bacterium]
MIYTPLCRRLCGFVGVLVFGGLFQAVKAQELSRSIISLTPTFSLGASILEYDYAGDRPFRGLAFRAGAEFGDVFDAVLTGERWSRLGSSAGWSVLLEASYWPIGRRLVAPYLFFGLGRFDNEPAVPAGMSKGLGLGLAVRVASPVALRVEGLIRIDAGAGNDQLRALVAVAPWGRRLSQVGWRRHAQFHVFGMLPLSGPWRFVEPGYAMRFTTDLFGRHSGGIAIALLHWQIRNPASPTGYSWDTRAVLLMPEWRYRLLGSSTAFNARGGPLLSVMVEGPDDGFRGGGHVGIGLDREIGPLLASAGIDLMWLARNPRPSVESDRTDQRSVLIGLGVGF